MPNPNFKYNYETRIEVVMDILRGKRACDIEKERGINPKTISNWVNCYRAEAERRIKILTIDQETLGLNLKPESNLPNSMRGLFLRNLKNRQSTKKSKDCWRIDISDLVNDQLPSRAD